nr:MAG TPA: hypothetical protein [Caudoviricetes sp.]
MIFSIYAFFIPYYNIAVQSCICIRNAILEHPFVLLPRPPCHQKPGLPPEV